nr:Gfo/Idh/MocA family oxidoreductase [Poseidonocella sp. HB161398]
MLTSGAFDADPGRARAFAATQGLDPARSYGSAAELIAGERDGADRVEAVAICTPNATHSPIARALIEAGFDVICEKPLTVSMEDAAEFLRIVQKAGRFVGVTYTDCGDPLVHEARPRIAAGALGRSARCRRNTRWNGWPRRSRPRAMLRPPGAPIRRRMAAAERSAISAPMPAIWRASSPGCGWGA